MLKSLAISLVLTLILESIYGLIWNIKRRRDWLRLLLANLVTNPIVVSLYHTISSYWPFVALLEVCAVLAEWLAYRRWSESIRPAFLFALCANGFSFFGGMLLNYLIW